MGFCFVLFLWFWFCVAVFMVFIMVHALDLSSGNSDGLAGGGKVGGHVALKVEVSELLTLLELEKGLQLGIGIDATAVLLVLQVVVADVSVDLASDLSPGHLGAIGLSEKVRQLLGNGSGLHKTRGSAVANLAALLSTGLLSSADLLDSVALEGTKLGTKSTGKSNNLLQLGRNGSKLRSNGRVSGGGIGGRSIAGSGSNGGSGNWSSGGLGLLGSLGFLGGLHNLGGCGNGSGSRSGSGSGSGRRSGRRSGSLSRLSHGCWSIPSIEMSF